MYKISQQSSHNYVGVSGIVKKLDQNAGQTFVTMLRAEASYPTKDPTRQFAIAAVVINPTNESNFLAVKRPSNAKSLPDVWGLPAVILKYNEQPETAAARLAWEKLNTQVEFLGCLGLASIDRGEYELTLLDVVVKLVGKEPSVQGYLKVVGLSRDVVKVLLVLVLRPTTFK